MEISSRFVKTTLISIAVGIWIIVFQNFGIFPRFTPIEITSEEPLKVTGEVDVNNTVTVKGSLNVNLESINGYTKFYKDPRTGEYYVIPITDPYE